MDEGGRIWTIRDLMKVAIDLLQRKGIDDARLNVELLLSHALELPRISLYTSFDRPLTRPELERFRALCERRLRREPLQYIVGSTSFMGLTFQVDPRVFIPRPETETLVEQIMLRCNEHPANVPFCIVEVGTGSGNIAVSVAKYVKNASVATFDTSDLALEVARRNAELQHVEQAIEFHRMDVFEPVDQLLRRRFDLLASNPPYVARDEWEVLQEEIRGHEPRGAVTDENDGYEFYRRIIELAPFLLNDCGFVLVEVGYGQAATVRRMMGEAGFFELRVSHDLQGIARVVSGRCRARSRNDVVNN